MTETPEKQFKWRDWMGERIGSAEQYLGFRGDDSGGELEDLRSRVNALERFAVKQLAEEVNTGRMTIQEAQSITGQYAEITEL